MNFVINNYTFTTTNNPTSPSMKVESNNQTVYVDLVTSTRPEYASTAKVFVYSDTAYPYLRPYVTYNSLMGYIGNSYTSLAGAVEQPEYNSTTYYKEDTVIPNASELNNASVSNMTNWEVVDYQTTATGSHNTTIINTTQFNITITAEY